MAETCPTCGEFIVFGGVEGRGGRKFCSYECIEGWESKPFCDDCCASTGPEEELPWCSNQYFYGGTIHTGGARECRHCGSKICTRWFFLLLLIIPLGSYRAIVKNKRSYLFRRLPSLYIPHLVKTYAVCLSLVGIILWLLYYYNWRWK